MRDALQEDIETLTAQLDYSEALVDGLVVPGDADMVSGLTQDLSNAKERHQQLKQDVVDILEELEAGTHIVTQFQDQVQQVGKTLSRLDNEFNNAEPISREESDLTIQQRDAEEFLSKLNDMGDKVSELEANARELKSTGYMPEFGTLSSPTNALKKQFDALKEKATQRLEDVKDTARSLEAINDNLRRTKTNVDRASSELDMHEPIGSDIEAIKRQQEELKNLVQTAAPGVDTSSLESDIEVLTDKWSELSEKVAEREQSLDTALLQAGKFNEALDSILHWLKETEDLVNSQKPAITRLQSRQGSITRTKGRLLTSMFMMECGMKLFFLFLLLLLLLLLLLFFF
ncbi:hypothetical protein KUTeg_015935 [Tegillarca granosa]|uniref:Uncharacterized protein n=1 Tax=Tegillarca granosa TaxID=220873 RepID=A0ABQ9EJM1_TEGGR|nr:hypothetical protein KUTeg_015935 [Tegillarca granosa]